MSAQLIFEPENRPPRLRLEGSKMIRPNGKETILNGLSWGSWGVNIVPTDGPLCKSYGCSVIRDPLRWWGDYGQGNKASPPTDARDDDHWSFTRRANIEWWFAELLSIVASGMWAAPGIDTNCGQDGLQSPGYCDPLGLFPGVGRNLYTDPPMLSMFCEVWKAVARVLQWIPNIAWLELLPEPLYERGPEWAEPVRAVYRRLMAEIDSVAPGTPYLIGARDAYNPDIIEEAFLEERTDCIYTPDFLTGRVTDLKKFEKGLNAVLDFRESRNRPVWINQLGRRTGDDRNLVHMNHALRRVTEEGIGFAWWQHRQNNDNPDDYALTFKDKANPGGWISKPDEIALLSSYLVVR